MKYSHHLILFLIIALASCKRSISQPPEADEPTSNNSEQQESADLKDNVPKLTGYVNDYGHMLSEMEEKELTSLLEKLETDIGSQVGILTIFSLNEEPIEAYSLRVANTWKLGRKGYNDGVLITVALHDRMIRIGVGLGLEEIITDPLAKSIIDTQMSPNFVEQRYYEGLLLATNKIDSLIRSNVDLIGIETE